AVRPHKPTTGTASQRENVHSKPSGVTDSKVVKGEDVGLEDSCALLENYLCVALWAGTGFSHDALDPRQEERRERLLPTDTLDEQVRCPFDKTLPSSLL
ncbi:hypothetical protein NHX12_009418, partial [Muraenolepis orangiensis]